MIRHFACNANVSEKKFSPCDYLSSALNLIWSCGHRARKINELTYTGSTIAIQFQWFCFFQIKNSSYIFLNLEMLDKQNPIVVLRLFMWNDDARKCLYLSNSEPNKHAFDVEKGVRNATTMAIKIISRCIFRRGPQPNK